MITSHDRTMDIAELTSGHEVEAAALWPDVGLTRPWNDTVADDRRALSGPTSTVLGTTEEGVLVGTAMVGSDGHRGWIHCLALSPHRPRTGIGAALVPSASRWLAQCGAPKILLMVRDGDPGLIESYDRCGFARESVRVTSRWIEGKDSAPD